jgi:CDP-diacylglycerol---serine O-phosphatidyltransferase
MSIKKHIPNFITCLNLVCGCLSIIFALKGSLLISGFAIMAAAVFDFCDGFVARLLHVKGELGKQLDSLCDVVSFGVAPGIIMLELMFLGESVWKYGIPDYVFYISILIPVCAALRLAKFNIDVRQSDSFIGLPTPAVGLLIAALPAMLSHDYQSPLFPFNDYILHFVLNPGVLIGGTIVMSLLMVSGLPLFAMKFKSASWKENKLRYLFIIISLLLILLFFFTAVPIIILVYILISVIKYFTDKKTQTNEVQSRD